MTPVRRFVANRAAVVGVILVGLLVVVAIVAPAFTKDPIAKDIDHGLTALGAPIGPSSDALLGTDHLGRDVWARVVAGAGTSLSIACLATLVGLLLGLGIGVVAGYRGGWIDVALMRVVDLALAFPYLLLAILLAALLRETSLAGSRMLVAITLGFVGWTTIARITRGKAMSIARSEHVVAARALGASGGRIILRHVLPNMVGIIVVVTAIAFAQNLLAESILSFLGLGPAPPAATWGRMVYEGRIYYRSAPHLIIAPGLAILLAVAAFNAVGEGLRDAFDPKERR